MSNLPSRGLVEERPGRSPLVRIVDYKSKGRINKRLRVALDETT